MPTAENGTYLSSGRRVRESQPVDNPRLEPNDSNSDTGKTSAGQPVHAGEGEMHQQDRQTDQPLPGKASICRPRMTPRLTTRPSGGSSDSRTGGG